MPCEGVKLKHAIVSLARQLAHCMVTCITSLKVGFHRWAASEQSLVKLDFSKLMHGRLFL